MLIALEVRSRLRPFAGQLYEIAAPASVAAPEHFFQSLHGLLRPPHQRLLAGQPFVSVGLVGRAHEVRLCIWIPRGEEDFISGLLRGAHPGVELTPVSEPQRDTRAVSAAQAGLARGSFLPIETRFDADPLAGLTAALARAGEDEELTLELVLRPKTEGWQRRAIARAQHLREGRAGTLVLGLARHGSPWEFERRHADAIEHKAASRGFDCALRVVARADQRSRCRELLRSVTAAHARFAGTNHFSFGGARVRGSRPDGARRFPLVGGFTLTVPELAGLWHLPHTTLPSLAVLRSPKLPPPSGVQHGDRLLGIATWAGDNVPVRLSIADSRHHFHLLGATGTGKSTALLNLAVQDVEAGRGIAVLDPKGDLVQGVLARIPRERSGDVILISPDDSEMSVGLNPLELGPADDPELVAENTLTIFKRIYERFWGMRTDDVLKSSLLTVLRTPQPTLAHIPALLGDARFRRRITSELHDPLGLDGFWRWFEGLTDGQRGEAIGPVLNKLRDFLVRPRLRRLLCQPRSTVDPRTIVDSGQILLADLNVGRWGETAAALVGSFLVAKLWQAVLARSAIAEERRRDYSLYIDEFQNFVGIAGPFADALAQARSLRLSLTIANQHLGQLPRELREAIRSNARSRAVFQCGQDDASALAHEFSPLDATALMSLARFEAAARLSVRGQTSAAFTLRTLPAPPVRDPQIADEIRAGSRQRYATKVALVDAELERALGLTAAPLRADPVGDWEAPERT